MTQTEPKVCKNIKIHDAVWLQAKVEAVKRGEYYGDFLESMIKWCMNPQVIPCPHCKKDIEVYPPDYIK